MNDIAHLSFKGGGLVLPAQTPYERELLVESIEATTKRHGRILLAVADRKWTVSVSTAARSICDACSQWPEDLTYPGGSNGTLAVVSSRATLCREINCELAHAATQA